MRRHENKGEEKRCPPSGDSFRVPADEMTNWQTGGFRMQPTRLEEEEGLHAGNDQGYRVPWSGSAPDWMDPFNDSAVDPSIVKERSTNLVDHVGGFWAGSLDVYTPAPDGTAAVRMQGAEAQAESRPRLKINRRLLIRVLTIFAVLLTLLLVTRFVFLSVRGVTVRGNAYVSSTEVIRLSGIQNGMNVLSLNADQIRQRISQNRYLILKRVAHRDDDYRQIILEVEERKQDAYVIFCGIHYLIDETGMVLDSVRTSSLSRKDLANAELGDRERQQMFILDGQEASKLQKPFENMLRVEGMNISNCSVGSRIALKSGSNGQMEIFRKVIREMEIMDMAGVIRELYLKDQENICLYTCDGYYVRLGNADRIHAKLRALKLTLEAMKDLDCRDGTIDVETPEKPTWIPDGA